MNKLKSAIAFLSVLGLLTACGGGGSSGSPPAPPNNPPGPTGIVTVGPISNFGSVVVNGVRYETSNATFMIDDTPGSESDLAVGHVITVRGTVNANGTSGTASTIFFAERVVITSAAPSLRAASTCCG